jgi:hypothetical protein
MVTLFGFIKVLETKQQISYNVKPEEMTLAATSGSQRQKSFKFRGYLKPSHNR